MSQFTNPLVLTLLEDAGGKAVLRDGRAQWLLSRQLVYDVREEFSGESVRVPVSFVTDLASIPRQFWTLFPPDGPWVKAAVVHDFLYATHGTGVFEGYRYIDRLAPYTRAEADKILDEAMAVVGVPAEERVVIYEAVRVGGAHGWGT